MIRRGGNRTLGSVLFYFDHNATSPLSDTARAAWLEATERFVGNPSSPHRLGARADAALTGAREKLANMLGCAAQEIIWTSGATESVNTAAGHVARRNDGAAWVSAVEHPCVLQAVERSFAGRVNHVPVNRDGRVDLEWLRTSLEVEKPALIAVMAANNETGALQPWRDIAELCDQRQVPFLCDAAQWIGKMPAAGLGCCTMLTGCAHKFGGPAGVGFLKCPEALHPLLVGGPQEDGRRAGTENVAGVVAMMAALEERESRLAGEIAERVQVRRDFEAALAERLPGAVVLGQNADRLWNTVSVMMPEAPDCRQRWVVKLDKLGFAVSTGSACASGKEERSHVLAAMGYSAAEAGRVLRFSSGWDTRPSDWSELLDGLARAAEEMKRQAKE